MTDFRIRGNTMKRKALFIFSLLLFLPGPAWCVWFQVPDSGNLNLNDSYNAGGPSLGFDGDTPYVAWAETSASNGKTQINVKYYNGASWIPVGGNLKYSTLQNASYPSLAMNGSTPSVAWSEWDPVNVRLTLRAEYYSGGAWQLYTAAGAGALNRASSDAYDASLAMSGATPYVAFCNSDGYALQLYVSYWSAGMWNNVGDPALNIDSSQSASPPSLAMNGSVPYVAWTENTGTHQLAHVKYYQTGVWNEAGNAVANISTSQDAGGAVSLVLKSGIPYLAYTETVGGIRQLVVRYLDNTSHWATLGAALNMKTTVNADSPSLAFNSSGVLFAVWNEPAGGVNRIFAKYYTGLEWDEVPGNPLNVNSANSATGPKLGVNGSGVPHVAFQEPENSVDRIFVKNYIYTTPTFTPTFTVTPTITPTSTITPTDTVSPSLPSPTITLTPNPAGAFGNVRQGTAAPNPFLPGRGQHTYFNLKIAQGAIIHIFNLQARLVRTLTDTREWDGRNTAGALCEGGIYIFQIESPNGRFNGTVVVINE
jgi:hypothetical protein